MPTFRHLVTLQRFVHADDADTALKLAHQGMQLGGNAVSEPFVIVESAAVEHTAVYPYLHAGEDNDLWQVSITVNTRLRAADACAASEAAHQLITVDPAGARTDAFEFEITVFSGDKAQPKLAS